MQRGLDNVCVSIFTKNARRPCNTAQVRRLRPSLVSFSSSLLDLLASYPEAGCHVVVLCVRVCSLTLCLDEMEYLCSDMSWIFHIPRHEIPIHSFQLPQQHHYLGVTGNAGETRKRHDHHSTSTCPCAFGNITNNENLKILLTDFKF